MLVQSTLRSRLPGVINTEESRLPCVFITGESRLPDVFTTRELRLASVFIIGESFWTPGSHFTDFMEHTAIFKRSIIQKIQYWPGSHLGRLILSSAPRGGGGDTLCILASRRWGPTYIASYTHILGSWVDFYEVLQSLMWWRNR
jgi:hypothetical protein